MAFIPSTAADGGMNADITTTATAQLAAGSIEVPYVVFQPENTKIGKNEQGSVDLFIENPGTNKATLHVCAKISVPPNICVSGLSGGVGGAGVVTAPFDIAPGKRETVKAFIQPTRTGVYILDCNTTYYPVGHEELADYISSRCEITVESTPTPTPIVTSTPEPKHVPVFEAMFVIAGVLGIFYLLMRQK